jgi:hypothetical protein
MIVVFPGCSFMLLFRFAKLKPLPAAYSIVSLPNRKRNPLQSSKVDTRPRAGKKHAPVAAWLGLGTEPSFFPLQLTDRIFDVQQ